MDNFKRYLSNMVGWTTSRKILVIESDDWGSIRMPSKRAFEKLDKIGVPLGTGDSMRYNRYDTLACEDDLIALFEVLESQKDSKGKSAVFTAVSVVANPDFDQIRKSNFDYYFYEPFTDTLAKYYSNKNPFSLWCQGIKNRLFIPQFHGREHLNIAVWMQALQKNDEYTHAAFKEECWGFNNSHPYGVIYQAAFDLDDPRELEVQHEIIREGLDLFENIHGYRSLFFVPPNGPFNNGLEKTAASSGIKYMSGSKIQNEALGQGKTRKRFHYLGQKNKHGQIYITRNCFFEPSQTGRDWVTSCLNEINIAFHCRKPAVISSHRVNFIGALDEENRKSGLSQLKDLLRKAIKKWPDIEFMTSDELGKLMAD